VPARNIKPWLWLAGLIILLDQISKWIVLENMQPARLDLRRAVLELGADLQPGAAFSFLSDAGGWQRWFFTVLALGVSGWIVSLMLRKHPASSGSRWP
jgi:signal peptidase II